MKNTAEHIEELVQESKEYLIMTLQLYKLQAVQKGTDLASKAALSVILMLVIAFFMLLSSIGLSIYLGNYLNSYAAGFFIVSLGYLILGGVFLIYRTPFILNPMANYLIKKIISNNNAVTDPKINNTPHEK